MGLEIKAWIKPKKVFYSDVEEEQSRGIINSRMSLKEIIVAMSEGNAGALQILCYMAKNNSGILDIYFLDSLGIRGSKIWNLYKNCSGEDIDKFYQTLELIKNGAYSREEIDANLNLSSPIPFLVKDARDYNEAGETFNCFHKNWDRFVTDNRKEVIPKLNEITRKYDEPSNGGKTR